MSERQKQNIRFWTDFCSYLRQRGSQLHPLESMKSDYKHYRDFQIGIHYFSVRAGQRVKKGLSAAFIIRGRDATTYFRALMEQSEEIHKECGEPLSWYSVASEKRIAFIKADADPTNEKDWSRQHEWIAGKFETLIQVFLPRIEKLKP